MGRFGGVELDDLELGTDRLQLRRWRPEDAGRVHQIMVDRSMFDFLALPDPYTLDAARDFATTTGHEGRGDGTGLGCAVVERDGGRVVGSAALRLGTDPEVGYWTAPDARGHGYAAEATRALAAWGFSAGLHRIHLLCEVRNVSSVATALAAGFRFEGVSRGGVAGGGHHGIPLRRGDLARFARLAIDPDDAIAPALPRLPGDELTDGTIALRVARREDAAQSLEAEDAESVRWGFTGEPPTLQQLEAGCTRAALEWLVGGAAQLSMIDVATGRVAGHLTMRRSGPPQVGGIGYSVHPDFRGRGYTARALRLLIPWAFDHAGIARLELGAKTGNVASQRAAERAGFEPDGIRRGRLRNADGSFGDEVRYALLNPNPRFSS
jgi:RimJ/RimL family protein N-acetyltransferase